MFLRFLILVFIVTSGFGFLGRSQAAIVFRPGEKAEYIDPGEEPISGDAQEIFNTGESAEKAGNHGRAAKAFRAVVRKHPRDKLAAEAAFRSAVNYEKSGSDIRAAEAYRFVVERYAKSPHFEEAIEAQFRIGDDYLNGKKIKLFGIPVKTSMDRAVEIFASVVRTAPYGKHTARAQFNIGLARERQGQNDAALAAYQAVIDKFPNEPIAADAQYQIGYLWYSSTKDGTADAAAADRAKIGFQDFLSRYPRSEKAVQARENLRRLENKQTSDAYGIAKFYDKRKNYRAAVIYYTDVIRQQPNSERSAEAKKRIEELRAKLGDKALELPLITATPSKKKRATVAENERGEAPAMRASPQDVAPLPPPETDVSLPPPASFGDDSTMAPELSPPPDSSSSNPVSESGAEAPPADSQATPSPTP